MQTKTYTKMAIAYDFDGTLAKGNIQENSFIPDLKISKNKFWQEVQTLVEENEMDSILAYMYLLINKAKLSGNVKFTKDDLKSHGKNVIYFKGVEDYFARINKYAKTKNIHLEHYIISSGTKEMIEGTSIASQFKYIYASNFKYDANNVPEWPAIAVNYTTKTQFLFRINKGVTNAWDNSIINKYIPQKERDIPFENMIYLGDGLTDVPAMKLVKEQGGISIGVYEQNNTKIKNVKQLLKDNRVSYIAPADYSDKSEIDKIIKATIDKISAISSIKQFSEY